MVFSECKLIRSLRRFYLVNAHTLLKSYARPFWYGVASLLLEAYLVMFTMVNTSVIDKLV